MAILTVTNTNDNGTGSLRAAIAAAQTGDTITFSSTLANQTITLASELELPRTLTLDGSDAPGLTLSGNNAVRVLDITGIGATVNINDLTIANGRATTGTGEERAGAAIRGTNNTVLNIDNVTFANNVAGFAGAIYTGFTSTNTITNSTFTNNDGSLDGSERGGGAIATKSNGSLTVINSTFTNNRGINGGAINHLLGNLTIEDSVFTNNTTTQGTGFNTNGYGGAVYVDGANASGPGFTPGSVGGTIAIRDSRFEDNTGKGQGGGLFLFTYSADQLVLEDNTILNNRVAKGLNGDAFGGGVRIGNGPYTIVNTTFANNVAESQGGGLWVGETAPGSITNSTFFNNRAIDPANTTSGLGGGLLFSTTSAQQVTNVTIVSNQAGTEGGGIVGRSNVTLTNTIVANNTANNPFGNKQNASDGQGFNASPPPIFSDGGGNLQWPAITNNFNDPNITATVLQMDPNLGTLQDNGNGVLIVPLLEGSAAIDAGVSNGAPGTDQRGQARPIDGDDNGSAIVDIGAFEFTNGVTIPTTLAIAATNAVQTEGNSGTKAFTFTVTRSGDTTGSTTVNWAVTGSGTNPANAADFGGGSLPVGIVTFAGGETTKAITIAIQGDTIVEPDETFTVTLSNPSNGATLETSTATGTIANDDIAVVPEKLAQPIVIDNLDDITTDTRNDEDTIDLFSHFDDPFTTGLVARFELFDPSLGGGITEVLLFDQDEAGAPLTVDNFINYILDGDYDSTIIHRSIPGSIIQGGGFTVEGLAEVLNTPALAVGVIPTDPPVQNEFSANRSNIRGTIAMAKLENDPNSATSQWFFNLADNSDNLDNQNGGFTVFGEVLSETDLAVLDAIAAVPRFNASTFFNQSTFTGLPLIVDDPSDPVITGDENLVRYQTITLLQQDELTFAVIGNSNPSLVNVTVADDNLILDYLPGQVGTANITVRATNLVGASIEDTFSVTVSNAVPTTTGIQNLVVNENATTTVISLFDAFADVEDEDEALTYAVLNNTNTALFTSVAIDPLTGQLSLDYAADRNGVATLTVQAQDTLGQTVNTSFTVTVLDDDTTHTPAQVIFEADSNNLIRDVFAYDLTAVGMETSVIVRLASRNSTTEDAFDNLVGFYEIADVNGGIDTDNDGVADLLPNNPAAYAEYVITNRVEDFLIRAGSLGDPAKNTTIEQFGEVVLMGGKRYAPFLLANGGDIGFEGFIEAENQESDGVFNDAGDFQFDRVIYFPYQAANPDGWVHLKSFGEDSFGFEDVGSNLDSDQDFDDITFQLAFAIDQTTLPSISLAVSPTTVSETGTANLTYTFSRTGDTTNVLTVNYSVGGTATFSSDYTQTGATHFSDTTGSVTFTEGSNTATVTFDPLADDIPEEAETVALTLTDDLAYTVGTSSPVTGTITDDTSLDNTPPQLDAIEKTGLEDTIVTFALADFTAAFRDEFDEDDNLQAIRVISLPASGALTLNTTTVTPGLLIAANQLSQLRYTPAADRNGDLSFQVTAQDDGEGANESEPATVTLKLTPVNDAPQFSLIDNPDQVATAGQILTVEDFATQISPGPDDEKNQSLSFILTTTGDDIFSQQPQLSVDGTLAYALASTAFGVATLTISLRDDGGVDNGGIDTSPARTFTITATRPDQPAIVLSDASDQGLIRDRFAYDLSPAGDGALVVTQLAGNFVDRIEAAFDNWVGFYEVVDATGGIDTDGDGVADLLPQNQSAYAEYAIRNRVEDFLLRGGSWGDPDRNTTVEEFGDLILTGGKRYAPFILANGGAAGFDGFITTEQAELDGIFNDSADFDTDRVLYFAYIAANPDGVEHLKSFGNNIFGFEDLPGNLGVSDNDFDDAFFQFNFSTIG